MTCSSSRAGYAGRNRATSLALVTGFLVATHVWLPEAEVRSSVQYLFVVTLGYGHLLGAVAVPRSGCTSADSGSPRILLASFRIVATLTGLAAYAWVIGRMPGLVLPLLAVSAWHTVENDLAIGRGHANGWRVGPMPRTPGYHVLALGMTGCVVAVATWTESWRELTGGLGWTGPGAEASTAVSRHAGSALLAGWFDLPDLFVLVTLHHLLSWLLLLAGRVRALRADGCRREATGLCRRLAVVHLGPALLCGTLLALPAEVTGSAHLFVFGPAVYLYWSVLHVVQTSWRRGIEARVVCRARPSFGELLSDRRPSGGRS